MSRRHRHINRGLSLLTLEQVAVGDYLEVRVVNAVRGLENDTLALVASAGFALGINWKKKVPRIPASLSSLMWQSSYMARCRGGIATSYYSPEPALTAGTTTGVTLTRSL